LELANRGHSRAPLNRLDTGILLIGEERRVPQRLGALTRTYAPPLQPGAQQPRRWCGASGVTLAIAGAMTGPTLLAVERLRDLPASLKDELTVELAIFSASEAISTRPSDFAEAGRSSGHRQTTIMSPKRSLKGLRRTSMWFRTTPSNTACSRSLNSPDALRRGPQRSRQSGPSAEPWHRPGHQGRQGKHRRRDRSRHGRAVITSEMAPQRDPPTARILRVPVPIGAGTRIGSHKSEPE